MKRKLFASSLVAGLLMIFTQCSENDVVTPHEQQAQTAADADERDSESARKKQGKYISTPVAGTINGLPFSAEYRITEFVTENDVLYSVGYLTDIAGEGLPEEASQLSSQTIKMPVDTGEQSRSGASSAGRTAACDVLLLDLGPLDLDLLGLVVHLDQVVLEIVAETGAGNLVGNLLCAVTGLLDGVAALQAIANLLNQIISIIGTLP